MTLKKVPVIIDAWFLLARLISLPKLWSRDNTHKYGRTKENFAFDRRFPVADANFWERDKGSTLQICFTPQTTLLCQFL